MASCYTQTMSRLLSFCYKFGYLLMKMFWFITRPKTFGTVGLITHNDRIILIRHTYGSPLWTVVGGGIKHFESPEEALTREIHEETGLNITNFTKVGVVFNNKEFKRDTIHVFIAPTKATAISVASPEIKEANWFRLSNLPTDTSPLCKEFIALSKLQQNKQI